MNDKDVIPPYIFFKGGLKFSIAEVGNDNGTEFGAIALGYLLGQVLRGAAGENFYFVGHTWEGLESMRNYGVRVNYPNRS